MDRWTLDRLRALPPLAAATVRAQARPCKVCRAPSPPFDVVDLNKFCSERDPYAFGMSGILVTYFRCRRCGLLFTDFFDDWSADDFRSFIYNADYVKVDGAYVAERPRELADLLARKAGAARGARVLDYGSGAGVFARSLRDHGFRHVAEYDPFSSPARPAGRFDLITCFEVIEHATMPDATLRDIRSLLADGGCVLLTTGIQPDDIEARRASWWYVGPRNGHVAIFTSDALASLARSWGLVLHAGGDMLAFTDAEPSDLTRSVLRAGELPYEFIHLTAPAAGTNADGWHESERDGPEAFRWTASPTVAWPAGLATARRPCRVRVALPFAIEIVEGFAARARVWVDEEALGTTRVERGVLSASGVVTRPGPGIVRVETPNPVRPNDVGTGGDDRALGLAIPTGTAILADSL